MIVAQLHAFSYSEFWAELVVSQLRARFGSDPSTWGYVCLCVDDALEKIVEDRYQEIDTVTGEFLQVFTMAEMPLELVFDRVAVAQERGEHELAAVLNKHMGRAKFGGSNAQKTKLLSDLRAAGLSATEKTDFLFFDFRAVDAVRKDGFGSFDIDVIAAKALPIDAVPDAEAALALFRKMANVATKCAREGAPVEKFVKKVTFLWDAKIAYTASMSSFNFVQDFIKKLLAFAK